MIDEVRVYTRRSPPRRSKPTKPPRSARPTAPATSTATPVPATRSTCPGAPRPQHGRHQLPRRALPGAGLHQLHPDRTAGNHHLPGHERHRQHQLQLPRSRGGRLGNAGAYSTVATATTGLSITPSTAVLTFTQTAQFAAQGPGAGASRGPSTAWPAATPPSAPSPLAVSIRRPAPSATHTVTASHGRSDRNRNCLRHARPGRRSPITTTTCGRART